MRYRLTEAAKRDVRDIVRHIKTVQKSPQNAATVAQRLKVQFRRLAETPGLGHVREELHDETVRVIEVSGLLVIYHPTDKPLTILRVVHGARDLGRIDPR